MDVATKQYVDSTASGLPPVTSDDNGKVLKVVEGVWAKGDDANTASVQYVECTTNGSKITLPETITVTDIYNLIMNGTYVILKVGARLFTCRSVNTYQGKYILNFIDIISDTSTHPNKIVHEEYLFNSGTSESESIFKFNDSSPVMKASIEKTLSAGSTSVSFTDSSIGSDSIIDIYTSVFGVDPIDVQRSGTTLTVTFEAQQSSVKVRLVVM
jgi:hypothetical protein